MKDKKRYIRWLSLLPALIMMIVIFLFSSKTATVSAGTSSPIAEAIVRVFEALFGSIEEAKRASSIEFVNFLVRKAAHITEYAVLAVCISYPFWVFQIRNILQPLISLAISVAYAASDEFHQTFIEGRSGSIKDVGIDSIGIVIGCLIFFLWAQHRRKKAKRKQQMVK